MTIPHTKVTLPLLPHLILKLLLFVTTPHPKVTVPSGSHLTLWLLLSGDLPHLSDLSIDTALHLEESTLELVVVL